MNNIQDLNRLIRALAGDDELCGHTYFVLAEGNGVSISLNANDYFHWATADSEPLTAEDIPLIEKCKADAKSVGEDWFFHHLLLCRKRGRRPQKCVQDRIPKPILDIIKREFEYRKY